MKTFAEIGTSKGSNQLQISLTEITIEFMPDSSLNEFYKSYIFPLESWYNSFGIGANTTVSFKAKFLTKLHWTMNDGAYTVYACHDSVRLIVWHCQPTFLKLFDIVALCSWHHC